MTDIPGAKPGGSKIRTVAMWLGALILWQVVAAAYWGGSPSAYSLGYATGQFFVYGLISYVILRWSTKTRQLVPLGALLVAVLFLVKGHSRGDRARLDAASNLARAGSAMDAMMRGDSLAQAPGPEIPPEDGKGKLAWVVRQYAERYASAMHRLALEEGADADILPSEWPRAKYIADAAAFPNVEIYFLGYIRYLGKAREHYQILMDSIATSTVVEAGVGSADSADFMEGMSRAMASKRQANAEMFNSGEAYGQAALRLHYFLASVGSRVSYDSKANIARFAVGTDRERASVLLSDLQTSAAKLGDASRLRSEEQHQKLDALTALIKQ